MPPYQNGQNNQAPQGIPPQQPQAYGPPAPQPYSPQAGPAAPSPQAPYGSQPAAAAGNDGPNDRYDFFLNPEKPKRSVGLGAGLFANKLLLAVAAVGSIIVVLIAVAVISSGSKPNTDPLIAVAQTQQELIRVAQDGIKNAQDQNLVNFSVNTVESVSSAQVQLLPKIGIKPTDKILALGQSAQTTRALAAAQAASTYDTTYKTIMQTELETYKGTLTSASAVATSKSMKAFLAQQSAAALLLDTELNQ